MTTNEMIERYIYDVARRLPSAQREDISKELSGLIDDMMEEREENGKTKQENAEDVLKELGVPFTLAEKYRGDKKYLVGPEYYEQYWFVLKIVLIAVTVGMIIAAIVQGAVWMVETQGITQPQLVGQIAQGIGGAVANVIMGLVQGFAWVTIIFVLIERYSLKVNIREAMNGEWKPQSLREKPVPTERAIIKKGDSIAGIVFAVAVMILFNFVPYVMGFWLTGADGVVHNVPIFNLEMLQAALLLLNICFALGIIREVMRVIAGRYTLWLGVMTTVLNMAALLLSCIVFFNPAIWNAELLTQVEAINPVFFAGMDALTVGWTYFTRFFGCILIFAFVLDSAVALYKGIRYGRVQKGD